MDEKRPDKPTRGRGALGNPTGRYEVFDRLAVDDGWFLGGAGDPAPLRTEITTETSRTVITRNTSPDVPFDRSINAYRGCEHGCVYCFARPSHAYAGLSPGLDFETRIFAKDDAPVVLERELRRPGYVAKPIMLGANTDPYQPAERTRMITRGILEVLSAYRHPLAIATKSSLVVRDIDILAPMAADGLASVGVSLTTLDTDLARTMEPRAAAPAKRLATIRALAGAGIPTTVLAAPMIPHLNDHELERILAEASRAGASAANYILLRLPLELKELFTDWLGAHYPDRAARVLNQLREARDGNLYVADFSTRMRGTGVYADLLARRFRIACQHLGLEASGTSERPLATHLFRPPPQAGDQLSLL